MGLDKFPGLNSSCPVDKRYTVDGLLCFDIPNNMRVTVYNIGSPLGRSVGPLINDIGDTDGALPNCAYRPLLHVGGSDARILFGVVTLRDIAPGEELLADYDGRRAVETWMKYGFVHAG